MSNYNHRNYKLVILWSV